MERENKKRSKGGADIKERLCSALDILPDTLGGSAVVEIRGRNFLSVREGGSILLYTPEKIRVNTKEGVLCIEGKRLACISYSPGAMGIDGHIDRVSFEEV